MILAFSLQAHLRSYHIAPCKSATSPVNGFIARRNEGWQPEQKLSLDEALHAFTLGGAYAEFQEHQKGKLASGYLADFVVLSRDIFSEGPASIVETQVDVTFLGGEVVYNRSLGRTYNEAN